MSDTTKQLSNLDANQVLKQSANNDGTLGVNGFLAGKVGHKLTRTVVSSTVDDFRFFDIIVTKQGTITSGSAIISNLETTKSLVVGQYVFNSNIPANTTILSIDGPSQVTLSANATGSASTNLKFANLLQRLQITYSNSAHDDINEAERME